MDKLRTVICAKCKCEFGIPAALYEASCCSEKIIFYCPYGHPLSFPSQEEEEVVEVKNNVVKLSIVKKENDA